MRKLKMITVQDHLLQIVETTEQNDEYSCVEVGSEDRNCLLDEFSVFIVDGAIRNFTKDESGNWVAQHTINSPEWIVAKENVVMGSIGFTPTSRILKILPRDRDVLMKPIIRNAELESPKYDMNGLSAENIDDIMAVDRETFNVMAYWSLKRKMDPNTFEEIIETIDDQITDEIVFD